MTWEDGADLPRSIFTWSRWADFYPALSGILAERGFILAAGTDGQSVVASLVSANVNANDQPLRWLAWLSAVTCQPHFYWQNRGPYREVFTMSCSAQRRFTLDEWNQVLSIWRRERLIATIGTSNFGFSIALVFYKGPDFPGLDTSYVFDVDKDSLPADLVNTDDRLSTDDLWKIFLPIVQDADNMQRMAAHGIVLRERSYYEY